MEPENLQYDVLLAAAEETAPGKESPSPVAADTDASDESDYMEYKYGHYGRRYGNNESDKTDTPPASDNDAAADEESAKGDDAAETHDSATDDDNNTAQAEMPDDENQVAGDGTANGTPDDAATAQNNPADQSKEGQETTDETANAQTSEDDQCDCHCTICDAMTAIASRWADELLSQYGLRPSHVTRLLGW